MGSKSREDLLELKERIEKAKTDLSELKGRRAQLLEQLKKDHKISTLTQAETLKATLLQEAETLSREIQKRTLEMEEKYGL